MLPEGYGSRQHRTGKSLEVCDQGSSPNHQAVQQAPGVPSWRGGAGHLRLASGVRPLAKQTGSRPPPVYEPVLGRRSWYTSSSCSSAATTAVDTLLRAPRSQISPRTGSARCLEKRSRSASSRTQAMADRDDVMDVGAIEDDALNDDDEQDDNGDEVEEGYKMV